MQKLIAAVLVLLIAAAVAFFALGGGDPAPAPLPVATNTTPSSEAEPEGARAETSGPGADGSGLSERRQVASAAPDLLADPEIRAGLCGFRGRVVAFDKAPVADCGVRFYRGALDSILNSEFDLFAEAPTAEPQYIAGETRTAADGRFLITDIWPQGIYILFAGLGTDAPMHQLVTETPSPGEIVDLGDIVLPNAGVLVGKVVDADGEPLAGALVRAADVPGTLAGFFPVERFDPEGALLIRERQSPFQVVEMPPWVKTAFEHLPIPTTRTATDGSFRLVGVVPGSNMLAVTAKDFLSEVKPSVIVRGGMEKDVGTIRMREGEELFGKVVDTEGEPVGGAEILAGSTINLAPVDLARHVGKSDDEGRFSGLGFAPGKITVAARRGPGHAWVLAEPQPVVGDVVVVLPAVFGVDVTITTADGQPAKEPRLRLLQGRAGDGAAELAVFGLVPPVSLRDRLEAKEEPGQWRITNLLAGRYSLVADMPGYAAAVANFKVGEGDATVALQLVEQRSFTVRVLDQEGRPIRNAGIYARVDDRDDGRPVFDMPLMCGRTKADGSLLIDKFRAKSLRVSADHPKYGTVHGEARLGEELVLTMLPPGAIEGVLTSNGAPPEAGKYTILVEWRRNGGVRGPLETTPRLVTPGVDGRFRIAALQPGQYRLMALDALSGLRSPGGIVQMAMSQAMFSGNMQREEVDVVSGQTAQAQLDTGEKPIEGPTAHLFGSVVVDGRVGEGYQVMAWVESRRYLATTDRAGRFDFGVVPVGNAYVTVASNDGLIAMGMSQLWSGNFELKEAEERELDVEIVTSSISGVVVDQAGAFVSGVVVSASGKPTGSTNTVRLHEPSDANGAFRFDRVPAGEWSIEVRGEGRLARGSLSGIELAPGIPATGLRIEMLPAVGVTGRLDLASLGNEKPDWAYLSFHDLATDGQSLGRHRGGCGVEMDDGRFSVSGLTPGTYGVRLHAGSATYRCQDLLVPQQGLEGVVLQGTREGR